MYSGVERTTTRKTWPMVRLFGQRNLGEIDGNMTSAQAPAPTSAIIVRTIVLNAPGIAWVITRFADQSHSLSNTTPSIESATRIGCGRMSSVRKRTMFVIEIDAPVGRTISAPIRYTGKSRLCIQRRMVAMMR